jgi:hypothetical protein
LKKQVRPGSGCRTSGETRSVTRLDLTIEDGKVTGYRARINVSFKYHMKL